MRNWFSKCFKRAQTTFIANCISWKERQIKSIINFKVQKLFVFGHVYPEHLLWSAFSEMVGIIPFSKNWSKFGLNLLQKSDSSIQNCRWGLERFFWRSRQMLLKKFFEPFFYEKSQNLPPKWSVFLWIYLKIRPEIGLNL